MERNSTILIFKIREPFLVVTLKIMVFVLTSNSRHVYANLFFPCMSDCAFSSKYVSQNL